MLADVQGYEFKDTGSTVPVRLYEALLSLTVGFGSEAVLRGGSGARARVFMSEGERAVESSTTATGWHGHALVWDMKRQGVEAGYDFPADEALSVSFSAGRRPAGR